jgi:hypothetical protein
VEWWCGRRHVGGRCGHVQWPADIVMLVAHYGPVVLSIVAWGLAVIARYLFLVVVVSH